MSRGLADIRAQHAELKRRHPGTILLFRRGPRYWAFDADADEVKTIAGAIDPAITIWVGTHPNGDMTAFGAARLETVLAAIVAASRRAAVLERVAGDTRPVRGPIERITTEGTFDE